MTKRIAIILIALTSVIHGQTLVDLTPGGFQSGNYPPIFWRLFDDDMHFYDEAAQGWFMTPFGPKYYNGWVSLYGDLNGGKYFFTDLFVRRLPPTANIWWNFIGGPRGFKLAYIHTFGRNARGQGWEHIYEVRYPIAGQAPVTVDGRSPVMSIAFYGYEQ